MKALGLALLVGGIVLLVYGISASNSFSSNVSQTVTGKPTNNTVILLASGGAAVVAGLVLALRPSRR